MADPAPIPAAEPTPSDPPAAAPPTDAPPAAEDGKGGKDAVLADLAKERDKRQAAEKRAAELEQAGKTQLDAIAKALGLKEDDAPDATAIASQLEEAQLAARHNAAALTRFQVAVEKAVPSHLVEFVVGETREEVEASVEKVLAAFSSANAPRSPQPDPSQGQQGSPTSLDAQIAAAEQAGNTREVIRLKARKGLHGA